jgi:periplasmic mercuric ion binding protein
LLAAALAPAAPLTAWAGAATAVLDVQNMTRGLCPVTVKQVPGAAGAEIDFKHKTATVTFDADRVSAAALVKATTDAGYPSTLRQ